MGLKFIGAVDNEGRPLEYIGWAPARDLTDAECAEIGEEKVAALIASNLYAKETPGKPARMAGGNVTPAGKPDGEEG